MTFVRRRLGETFKKGCVVPTGKHDAGTIVLWRCMTDSGVGQLFVCGGRMNSMKYINLLESALLPSFKTLFGDTNMDGVQIQRLGSPFKKFSTTFSEPYHSASRFVTWRVVLLELNPIHVGIAKKSLK